MSNSDSNSSPERPVRWADLKPEEVSAWLDLPAGRLFRRELEEKREAGLWQIYENVNKGDMDLARINVGAMNTLLSLMSTIQPPEMPAPEPEEPFRDPAALPEKKGQ